MTSPPWLSVIMPSYQGEAWIAKALESVAAQRSRDLHGIEVILIDGSPAPHSIDMAATFSDRLRIRAFHRPDLASWHTKSNFGVAAASAEHVCWLGVDDLWLPGRAVTARHWIDAAPRAAMHVGPCAIIDVGGRECGIWRCPLATGAVVPYPVIRERLLIQNFIAAPAPVIRRDAWLTCGGLDESLWYTADWDLWLKLAASGDVHYHGEVTVGFRIHRESLTVSGARHLADFEQQMLTVLERYASTSPAHPRHVLNAARASISVNCALAAAADGDRSKLPGALLRVLRLGPRGIRRYLRDSRIVERTVPRLKARWAGRF